GLDHHRTISLRRRPRRGGPPRPRTSHPHPGDPLMSWRSYAQLVRLPNLPSALADIGLAGLATGLVVARLPVFLLLLTSSACLYLAGMVWNDYFDLDQDRRERPDRPIPSGAITLRRA